MTDANAALLSLCLLEALAIIGLVYVNAALHNHLCVITDLMEDTAAAPLDLPLTKDRK